jgi:hypothetical protein
MHNQELIEENQKLHEIILSTHETLSVLLGYIQDHIEIPQPNTQDSLDDHSEI